LAFLTFRFFQHWKIKKETVSKVFCLFSFCFFLYSFRSILSLFFLENHAFLFAAVVFAAFIQGVAAALACYLLVYLKFPKISPLVVFFIVFILGLIVTGLTFTLSINMPVVEASGAVKWNFISAEGQLAYLLLRTAVLLLALLPLIFLTFHQFATSTDFYIKMRALGLGLIFVFGVIISFLDFLFISYMGLEAIIRDMVMIFLSIVIFMLVFFTQKPPKKNKEQVYSYPSERINSERVKW